MFPHNGFFEGEGEEEEERTVLPDPPPPEEELIDLTTDEDTLWAKLDDSRPGNMLHIDEFQEPTMMVSMPLSSFCGFLRRRAEGRLDEIEKTYRYAAINIKMDDFDDRLDQDTWEILLSGITPFGRETPTIHIQGTISFLPLIDAMERLNPETKFAIEYHAEHVLEERDDGVEENDFYSLVCSSRVSVFWVDVDMSDTLLDIGELFTKHVGEDPASLKLFGFHGGWFDEDALARNEFLLCMEQTLPMIQAEQVEMNDVVWRHEDEENTADTVLRDVNKTDLKSFLWRASDELSTIRVFSAEAIQNFVRNARQLRKLTIDIDWRHCPALFETARNHPALRYVNLRLGFGDVTEVQRFQSDLVTGIMRTPHIKIISFDTEGRDVLPNLETLLTIVNFNDVGIFASHPAYAELNDVSGAFERKLNQRSETRMSEMRALQTVGDRLNEPLTIGPSSSSTSSSVNVTRTGRVPTTLPHHARSPLGRIAAYLGSTGVRIQHPERVDPDVARNPIRKVNWQRNF